MEELGPISEHPNQHCGLDSMEQYPLPASAPPHPRNPPAQQSWVLLRLLTLEGRFWGNLTKMCSDLLHFMGLSSKINELLLRWLLNHLPRGKPQRMTSTVLLKVYHEWGRESWLEVSTPGRPASPLDVSK